MEDVEEEQPARRKEHRRVPSTIAMDEVKVSCCDTLFCEASVYVD
jgi:phosphatidylinositol 4-kinase